MEEKNIQKHFILEIDEAKTEMIQSINNIIQTHKLPLYIVNMILSEIGVQIRDGAINELKMAQEQIKMANTEDK